MAIRVASSGNVQTCLKELLNAAYSMKQNLEARVDTPVLPDGTNLFGIWLDSKTIQLYGGVNEDNRHRFKIDHNYNLSTIVNASVSSDGSISLHKDKYLKSEGTEFIIISRLGLGGAKSDYAVRADKYTAVREQLNKGEFTAEALEKAGGFKINHSLTPGEAGTSDGWIEMAVGKNRATAQDYASVSGLLQRYIAEAQERGCFGGGGMGFYVETGSQDYKARPWFVFGFGRRSDANGKNHFTNDGRFLQGTPR